MLRIFLWRLCFEFFSLLKVLGWRGPATYYFAYGGNLDPAVLEKRRITALERIVIRFPNHILRFNHEAPFEGVGFASIEKAIDSEVPGVLIKISKVDQWRMDCFEGHFIFRRYLKRREVFEGRPIFYYVTGRPKDGLKPSTDYLNKLINGFSLIEGEKSDFLKCLKLHESVATPVRRNPPRFLINNYQRFGRNFAQLLIGYDRLCMRLFVFFIFRPSIFQNLIPYQISPLNR